MSIPALVRYEVEGTEWAVRTSGDREKPALLLIHVVVGGHVCATDDPTMQESELKVLRKGFARVVTAEEIEAELGRRGSPVSV